MAEATEAPDVLTRLTNFLDKGNAPPMEESAPVEQEAEAVAEEQPKAEDVEQEKPEGEKEEEKESSISLDPDAPMFEITVKVEGGKDEVKQVSLNELEKGYMMQADYVRKTQELAKARESMTAEVQKAVEPERQQYVQNLQLLQQQVMALVVPELQNVNWDQLSNDDPALFVKLSAKANKVQQTVTRIQQEQAAAQQKSYAEVAEYSKRMLADPVEGIPGWSNELYQSLINDASKMYGFKPEEVAQVVDYRMMKVLHDAQQFRKLQAAKPNVEKRIKVAPKLIKAGAPAGQDELQAKTEKELQSRLRKSGDLKDAAALYLSRQTRKTTQ